jgi:hypothetical protein
MLNPKLYPTAMMSQKSVVPDGYRMRREARAVMLSASIDEHFVGGKPILSPS